MVATATAFAILGITGAPFFNGSISKYMIAHGSTETWVAVLLNIVNIGTVMSFVKYSTKFFGKNQVSKKAKTDKYAVFASLLMGITSLVIGIFGENLTEFFFNFEVSVNPSEYLEKGITYFIMIGIGILVYHRMIKHGGIITSMVGYLIVVILYLNFAL